MKKPKILLIGYEEYLKKTMLMNELKALSQKFEILFIQCLPNALDEIAKAKFEDRNPIRGLVFSRQSMTVLRSQCKFILSFAEMYASTEKHASKEVIAISMINNDQDAEARNASVSADYCKVNDWERVELLFEKILK